MDPLVMLILVPLAVLLVFAVVLGWRHPRQGTQIVGRSVSDEPEADARVKRRRAQSARRRRLHNRRRSRL
jgi:hypothetical protein